MSIESGKKQTSRLLLGILFAFLICDGLVVLRRLLTFPIFTDEIAYQLLNARAYTDGLMYDSLFLSCPNGGNGVPAPLTLIPGLLLNSVIFLGAGSAKLLRLTGILLFCGWLLSLLRIWKCAAGVGLSRFEFALFVFTALAGTLPVLLSSTRPEILLGITLNIFIAESIRAGTRPSNNLLRQMVVFFLLPSWMFVIHPKFGFWLPLVLFASWRVLRSRTLRLLHWFWIAALTMQSAAHYRYYFSCPEEPLLGQQLQRLNSMMDPALLQDPLSILSKGMSNILSAIAFAFQNLLVGKGSWTGLDVLWGETPDYTNGIIITGWLLLALFVAWGYACRLLKRNISFQEALALISVACLTAYLFFQQYYFYYYPGFTYLILAPVVVLFNSARLPASFRGVFQAGLLGIAATVTWSIMSRSWFEEGRYSAVAWRMHLPLREVYSESSRGSEFNAEVERLAADCSISSMSDKQRCVVDEATYFALRGLHNPIISQNIWGIFGVRGPFSVEELSKHNIGRILTRCERMPNVFREQSIQRGELCCFKHGSPP